MSVHAASSFILPRVTTHLSKLEMPMHVPAVVYSYSKATHLRICVHFW